MLRDRNAVRCLALGVSAAVVLAAALSGRQTLGPTIAPDGKYGPYFRLADRYEYGRPFVYMRREPVLQLNPPNQHDDQPWAVLEGVAFFDTRLLALDLFIGGATILMVGVLLRKPYGRT